MTSIDSPYFTAMDRQVMANLIAAGHKILSVRKYPKPDKIIGPSIEKPKSKLTDPNAEILPQHRRHREKAIVSREKIISVLKSGEGKLVRIASLVELSPGGVKSHLDAMISEGTVDRHCRTKLYKLL